MKISKKKFVKINQKIFVNKQTKSSRIKNSEEERIAVQLQCNQNQNTAQKVPRKCSEWRIEYRFP